MNFSVKATLGRVVGVDRVNDWGRGGGESQESIGPRGKFGLDLRLEEEKFVPYPVQSGLRSDEPASPRIVCQFLDLKSDRRDAASSNSVGLALRLLRFARRVVDDGCHDDDGGLLARESWYAVKGR